MPVCADSGAVCQASNKERGMALLVVMVLLVLIGLIAVVGAQEAQLQTRMSASSQHYAEASLRAETLLVRLEHQLESRLDDGDWTLEDFSNGSVSGLHSLVGGAQSGFDPLDPASWAGHAQPLSDTENQALEQYVIEYLGRAGAVPLNMANAEQDRRRYVFRLSVQAEVAGAVAVIQSETHLEGP